MAQDTDLVLTSCRSCCHSNVNSVTVEMDDLSMKNPDQTSWSCNTVTMETGSRSLISNVVFSF